MEKIKVLKQALYELRLEKGVTRNEELLDDSVRQQNTWMQKSTVQMNAFKCLCSCQLTISTFAIQCLNMSESIRSKLILRVC